MNDEHKPCLATQQLWLRFRLESDATFGRGDGIPGLIDRDVALDEYGCPYLHGRTLKGLLGESCADLLFALEHHPGKADWKAAADALLGIPGSRKEQGILRVGHAQLPAALYATIRKEVERSEKGWTRQEVTASLTTIRRQTALEINGAPDQHTLRSIRVILRETRFEAQLTFMRTPELHEQALLSACVKGLRRAGIARNRGRGRIDAWLEDETDQKVSDIWFTEFKQKVGAA